MANIAPSASGLYVGIDVAKDKLDLATSDAKDVLQFANDKAGIAKVVKQMRKAKPVTIVIESTGGLERPLLYALLNAKLPAALVHPGRVRQLAKGMGVLAKTDTLDAHVLVMFGQKASPRLTAKLSQNQIDLRDLVACRHQLVVSQTQQKNRRRTTVNAKALQSCDAVLQTLADEIESLEAQIREMIEADDDFKDLDRLLQTVPGVGPGVAAVLLADLPELGNIDRQKISAIVGVAPFADDSGTMRGQRHIQGGRADVRNVLYMGTVSAITSNPLIKAFAVRLRAANKKPKVIIVACMRKLLSLLNAIARDRVEWLQLNVVKNMAAAA